MSVSETLRRNTNFVNDMLFMSNNSVSDRTIYQLTLIEALICELTLVVRYSCSSSLSQRDIVLPNRPDTIKHC